nr:apoptotic enhancer 1 protein-like [Dermatophagoides farinae]
MDIKFHNNNNNMMATTNTTNNNDKLSNRTTESATSNNNNNNNNVEMQKNLFPHRFMPNSNSNYRHGNSHHGNSIQFPVNSKESNQQQQKNYITIATKPSVPVKPIATTTDNKDLIESMYNNTAVENDESVCNIATNKNEIQVNSFPENDCNEEKEALQQQQQQQQRSNSVVEIVNKLNNLSCKESWEKMMKRRPVYNMNEMEKELEKSSSIHNDKDEFSVNYVDNIIHGNDNSHDTTDKCTIVNNKNEQDDAVNNNNNNNNGKKLSNNPEEMIKDSGYIKRMKGGLKKEDVQQRMMCLRRQRRVSFDPLALLLDASLEGELELVKKTAIQVPNPSSSNDEGITALHNATCAGHFDIVKFLVEIGCDVNVQDSDGWTPLHCAASCNNLTMIKFLVKSGACIFATTFSDLETAAEKCEEEDEGFDGCSQYLYGIQEKLGLINNGIVYALYDYDAQNEDELSFKEGDIIKVLRKGDENEKEWWWSKIGNNEGYVPRNLIGLFARIKPKDLSFKSTASN